MMNITSPKDFFGVMPGDDRTILHWDKIAAYFDLLATQSDCIQVTDMGPSTEGNRFLQVIITSADNMANLETYRQNSMKLADPRGLSQEEIDDLIKNSKAVCVQSMSLHAIEIGGTQMSPLLAYQMLSSQDPEIKNILDQVIFIMVPCFNPDGEIMVHDWYYETLGTDHEGCNYPKLYHKYTGHDNNRDAYAHNIIESAYMGKILFKDWMPQSFQDHHHMGSYGARLFIAPYKEPVRPYTDPLIWRELAWYGANMAYKLEEEGFDGVSNATQFPGWGHYGYHWITNSHNIAGMLSESANCKLATPLYIHPNQLEGNNDYTMPKYQQTSYFPRPWKGGWWRLCDIVARQQCISVAQLDAMAKNRQQVLGNMAKKALRQTEAGSENSIGAFIISADQHDCGSARKLVNILLGQGIELHMATTEIKAGAVSYPAGSIVVPLAQPKYGLIMNLLGKTVYPNNNFTKDSNGNLTAFDVATDTVAEYMGVSCVPANADIKGELELLTSAEYNPTPVVQAVGYVLSARNNDNYHAANLLLKAGYSVYRLDKCPFRDFYVEGEATALEKIFAEAKATFRTVDQRSDHMTKLEPLKVAMYQHYYTGNADEGWSRLVLENFAYDYTTVMDADIMGGKLAEFDVLILPSDEPAMLYGPKNFPGDPRLDRLLMYVGSQPPSHQSGLGKEGTEKIVEFVKKGGRLLAFNKSSDYAIEACGLKVVNIVKDMSIDKFNTHGSTLKISVDTANQVGYGMPKQPLMLHWDGPVFAVREKFSADDYTFIASYPEKNILESGLLVGEELIAGKGAIVSAKCGMGQVVLYGCQPLFRAQTHGMFKTVFNMLYK